MNPEQFFHQQNFSKSETACGQETKPTFEIFKSAKERYFLLDVADNFINQIKNQTGSYDAFVFLIEGLVFLVI